MRVLFITMLMGVAQGLVSHPDDLYQKYFDSPIKDLAVIEPEKPKPYKIQEMTSVNGKGCTCKSIDDNQTWSQWSSCTNRNGSCHKAGQTRKRRCVADQVCFQIKRRHCVHKPSCVGRWGKTYVLNTTCDECGVRGENLIVKFCMYKEEIVQMCKETDKAYMLKNRKCFTPCKTDSSKNSGGKKTISTALGIAYPDNRQTEKEEDNKNWTTIILAVLSGILLVALLCVGFLYWVSSRTRRHLEKERDCKEVIDTAETFLSVSLPSEQGLDIRKLRRSGRLSSCEEEGGEISHSSSYKLVTESVRVEEIPKKSENLSLGKFSRTTKKSARDSLRSLSNVLRTSALLRHNKDTTLRHSAPDEHFFIESINLQGEGEVIVTSGKESSKLKKSHKENTA